MSIRFDAITDKAKRILTAPTFASAALTFMVWFKIINDRNDYSSVFFFGGTPNNVGVQTGADGTTLIFWDGTTEHNGSGLSIGAWNHIAWTKSSAASAAHKVYLNGVSDITLTGDGGVTSAEFEFGNDGISEWSDAELDYPRIWQAELTAGEVAAEYASATIVKASPWSYYDWASATGAGTDQSGNSRDLTMTGVANGASRPSFTVSSFPPVPGRLITPFLNSLIAQ